MRLEQRTICLIPVPFTNLASSKRRPVLVVSNDGYNEEQDDILVMAITSNLREKEFAVFIEQKDMESGTLKQSSMVRVDKIYCISKQLVIKIFGKIAAVKFSEVITVLNEFVKPSRI